MLRSNMFIAVMMCRLWLKRQQARSRSFLCICHPSTPTSHCWRYSAGPVDFMRTVRAAHACRVYNIQPLHVGKNPAGRHGQDKLVIRTNIPARYSLLVGPAHSQLLLPSATVALLSYDFCPP